MYLAVANEQNLTLSRSILKSILSRQLIALVLATIITATKSNKHKLYSNTNRIVVVKLHVVHCPGLYLSCCNVVQVCFAVHCPGVYLTRCVCHMVHCPVVYLTRHVCHVVLLFRCMLCCTLSVYHCNDTWSRDVH